MMTRKSMQLAFGITVSGLFIWLILRSVSFPDVIAALRTVDPTWVLIGFGAFVLGYACRIWRWRLMLASYNPELTWGRCAVPFMSSIAANNVLPFRAGDALRAVAFSKWLNVPTARVVATLLAERLMDLLSLMLALAIGLLIFRSEGVALDALLGWSASLFILGTIAVALVLLFPHFFEPPVAWFIGFLLKRSSGLATKVQEQVGHVFNTLATLAERSRMIVMMGWSALAWLFEACVFYSIARALPDLVAPAAAWLAMPIGTLSTMLPSTPGYIGTFHFFVMQTTELLGNPELAAAAFAFLVHMALYIPATVWGGVSFGYWVLTRSSTPSVISEKGTS